MATTVHGAGQPKHAYSTQNKRHICWENGKDKGCLSIQKSDNLRRTNLTTEDL